MRMRSSIFMLIFLSHLSILNFSQTGSVPIKHRYDSIFSFGDSLIDTGNLLISNALVAPYIGKLPYGQTFGYPTGRFSDGRLIVDFIAEEFGLPLLQPYLARSKGLDFRKGANFAVAGATALDAKFLYEKYSISNLTTNSSLGVQLGWFKELKSSLCSTRKDCVEYFRKSLFLVGEIGINDYMSAFFGGSNMKQIRSLVPLVMETIVSTTGILIEEGAVELVLPGGLPVGCSPLLLTMFYQSPNKEAYDPRNGCLKPFNKFVMYHNKQLKIALKSLRRKYPQAKIIYADYYGAAMRLIQSPKRYGLSNRVLSACCGGGGPYNYNASAVCGLPGSKACKDPSTYVHWDGTHLTEAAYRFIAKGILEGPYSSPPITLID